MLLLYAHFSEKLPHMLTSQPHFETCKQNSHFYNQPSTVFSAYHYWPFGYHWHICFMSMIKVKTQTRFMVLFTSRSLLTWGNLQAPCLTPPPVICLLFTLSNYIPLSFTDILWPNILSLPKRLIGGERTWLPCGGTLTSALNSTAWNSPVILRWNYSP